MFDKVKARIYANKVNSTAFVILLIWLLLAWSGLRFSNRVVTGSLHGIAALSLAYFVAIPWYPNHWLSVFIAIVRYGAALVFIVFVLFILVIDGSPTPLEISLPKEFQCTTRTFGMVPSAGEEVSLVKPIFPGAYILVSKQTIMDYENEGLSADKICTELLKAHINQR